MPSVDPIQRLKSLFPSIEIHNIVNGSSGGRSVFKARYKDMDIIAKLHPEGARKALQEATATDKAKSLLNPLGLFVPKIFDIKDEGILVEFVSGNTPDLSKEEDLLICLDYLLKMNGVQPPGDLENHFYGENLKNRIQDELRYFQEALIRVPDLQRSKAQFDSIYSKALDTISADTPGVIGHGDFQQKNLILTSERKLVPIDWGDFGLAHKEYDVGNLLCGVDLNQLMARAKLSHTLQEKLNAFGNYKQGVAIACVLRIGSNCRQIVEIGVKKEYMDNIRATIEIYEQFT